MFENSKPFSSFSVDDVPRAEEFYRSLGVEVRREGDMVMLRTGSDCETLVYPKDDHVPATFTVLNIPVDDIDAAVESLTAAGIALARYDQLAEVQDERGVMRIPGIAQAWFTDPAGNIVSVLQGD